MPWKLLNFQGRQHRSFAERPTATHAVNTETIANALKFHVKGMCIGSDSVRLQCNEHSNREQSHATLKVGVTALRRPSTSGPDKDSRHSNSTQAHSKSCLRIILSNLVHNFELWSGWRGGKLGRCSKCHTCTTDQVSPPPGPTTTTTVMYAVRQPPGT